MSQIIVNPNGEEVKGYKVFKPDWTCRGMQYTCPGTAEEDIEPVVCRRGLHFCEKLSKCFNYYDFDPANKVAEVVAYGTVVREEDGDKCCTNKLRIVRELTWEEVLKCANEGLYCTGHSNSGDYNSGDCNSGDYNSGDYNSGDYNSGDYNSGDCNSGDYNSGDYNECDFSNGVFNTKSPKIYMFNKPSNYTYRDWINTNARDLLVWEMPEDGSVLAWVDWSDMTEDEKNANPKAETTGGFLKYVKRDTSRQEWWDSLVPRKRCWVYQLPNFDPEVFEEVTSIHVDEEEWEQWKKDNTVEE